MRDIAGVSSTTLIAEPLLAGINSRTTVTLADGNKREVYFNRIGPDYFATIGIPVIAGRPVEARDHREAPRVIVINEAAAAALFGSESPLGRRPRMHVTSSRCQEAYNPGQVIR